MLSGGTNSGHLGQYDLSQKWTGLVLHVAGGEYIGLLLALHERLQTDVEDSRI